MTNISEIITLPLTKELIASAFVDWNNDRIKNPQNYLTIEEFRDPDFQSKYDGVKDAEYFLELLKNRNGK